MSCTFDLSGMPSGSQRRFTEMSGQPLTSPGGGRMVNLATLLRVIFRRALVQTSDMRLLPVGGISWSSSELALDAVAEARLPGLLLRLKNGDPRERVRYQRIRDLFAEFTQGRACEVRLIQVQQPPDQDGQAQEAAQRAVNLRHGGELAEFPVSLEATFGVIKQTPSLVPAAIRALPFVGDMPDPAQAPPEVVALAKAIGRLTK
jgi:hypothetical protein